MLVFMCLAPTASPENKVTVTEVLPLRLSVRLKQMMQRSVANPLCEVLESSAPREYDSVMGNAAGTSKTKRRRSCVCV